MLFLDENKLPSSKKMEMGKLGNYPFVKKYP
jgi:hypothetical protein